MTTFLYINKQCYFRINIVLCLMYLVFSHHHWLAIVVALLYNSSRWRCSLGLLKRKCTSVSGSNLHKSNTFSCFFWRTLKIQNITRELRFQCQTTKFHSYHPKKKPMINSGLQQANIERMTTSQLTTQASLSFPGWSSSFTALYTEKNKKVG